jgi:thiopeptide-type bacteriocin biosynthesis protein
MNNVKRTFIPGDEWLYLKVYSGYKTADAFLSRELPIIITKLENLQVLDKWFFIRYADPHSHIRLRFFVNHKENLSSIISVLNESMNQYVSQDLIWKVQFDTYQREIERYGFKTIEHAEKIFHIDSIAIIKILGIVENELGDYQRWQIALKMVDSFLNDFGMDLYRKLDLLTHLSLGFKTEFGFNQKDYKIQLDKKYRSNSKLAYEIISSPEKVEWFSSIKPILNKKSQEIKPISTLLIEMNQELEVPLNNLLESYIHMMINRLFRSKQRLTEMVLYDILERIYSSEVARIKYSSNKLNSVVGNFV